MASIQEHLDKIKNAIFGKDVRQSIHDGLNKINQETESTSKNQEKLERTFDDLIINAGNSNAEVAAARNGFETLGKRLDGVDEQLDNKANKNEVGSPLVANSIDGMTDISKVYVNTTDGNWYTWDGSEWVIGGIYNSQGIGSKSIDYSKTTFLDVKENLFNYNSIIEGQRYGTPNNSTIEKYSDSTGNYRILPPVKLYKGIYNITNKYLSNAFSFLVKNDIIISKLSEVNNSGELEINEDCELYLTLSGTGVDYSKHMLVNDNMPSEFKHYGAYKIEIQGIDLQHINEYVNENSLVVNNIYVGVNRDFNTIASAIESINDTTIENNIFIEDGIYNEKGLLLPNNVNLIGLSGNKDKVIINGENLVTASDDEIEQTSTLDLKWSNRLENLTILGRNLRYPIHSESSGVEKNWTQILNNCRVEHLGNDSVIQYRKENSLDYSRVWTSCHAWGEGASDGAYAEFNNCEFISVETAWYVHTNVNFKKPYIHVLNNCKLITKGALYSAYISSGMDSKADDKVIFNNCYMNGQIATDGTYNTTIEMNGCSEVPVRQVNTQYLFKKGKYPYITNVVEEYICSEETGLLGGQIVYFSEFGKVKKATSSTPKNLIAGYAVESASKGEMIRICKNGYYQLTKYLNTLGVNFKVDDTDGTLTKSTSEADIIIAIGYGNNFAKLI